MAHRDGRLPRANRVAIEAERTSRRSREHIDSTYESGPTIGSGCDDSM
jgi:hypothetical protein